VVSWLQRYPVVVFSVLAYAWTWACFGSAPRALTAMAEDRPGEAGFGLVIVLLAPFGPALSALVACGFAWLLVALVWLVASKRQPRT